MNEYPKRDPFYAHALTRLLFKSCAAQSIGQDAVLLIIHIAHAEDAARYQGPVRFWNSQLNEVLGFRSPKSLNNARQKAVEAGWLHYERKNDRADGRYWTDVPKHVTDFDDSPIEPESPSLSVPSTESIPSTEQKAEQESYALRNGKVTGNDSPPNPYPIPKEEREAPAAIAASSPSRDDCLKILETWETKTGQKCTATDDRIAACKRRLKDKHFAAHWREAIEKVSRSDFCSGKNERGWKATIDFLLTPKKFARIIDGEYDNKTPVAKSEFRNPTASELKAQRRAALDAESELQLLELCL